MLLAKTLINTWLHLEVFLVFYGFILLICTKFSLSTSKTLFSMKVEIGWLVLNTVQCCYNVVNFLTNIYKRHPIACPLGWHMGWPSLWYFALVPAIIYAIFYYVGLHYNSTWLYFACHTTFLCLLSFLIFLCLAFLGHMSDLLLSLSNLLLSTNYIFGIISHAGLKIWPNCFIMSLCCKAR